MLFKITLCRLRNSSPFDVLFESFKITVLSLPWFAVCRFKRYVIWTQASLAQRILAGLRHGAHRVGTVCQAKTAEIPFLSHLATFSDV